MDSSTLISANKCLACSHVWLNRKPQQRARKCPRCQCEYWDDLARATELCKQRERQRPQPD